MRRENIACGQVYHIFNRSIAEYVIFNNDKEFNRFIDILKYYQNDKPAVKYSRYAAEFEDESEGFQSKGGKLASIIAYCIMPTHFHLIAKQEIENGISRYLGNVQNSYSRYFNLKHKRNGPLWQGRFKSKLVENNEYLLHLTRYLHLNPVTAQIANKPEDWRSSSYSEYIDSVQKEKKICEWEGLLDTSPGPYKEFVEDRIDYQREIAKIKSIVLE